METSIAHGIDMTGKKAAYDTNVKRLLAEKIILAHILLGTVPEFAGMKPKELSVNQILKKYQPIRGKPICRELPD